MGLPGVQILEVFQRKELDDKPLVSTTLETGTINALIYRTVDQLLFSKHWPEAGVALVLLTGRTIRTLMEHQLEEKSGFSILVDGLEVPTLTGANQVVAAWQKWKQLEPLPEVQVDAAVREVGERTFQGLITLQSVQELRAVYSAISTHWFCPPELQPQAFLKAIQASETTGFVTAKADQGIKLGQHNVQTLEVLKEGTEMIHEPTQANQIEDPTPQPTPVTSTPLEPKPKARHRRKSLSVDPEITLPPEQGGETPAAALTAYARKGDRLQALAAGFQMHVPKPIEPIQLLTVIVKLLEAQKELSS